MIRAGLNWPQEQSTTHSVRFGQASAGLKRASSGNYHVYRAIWVGLNGPQEGLKQASRGREAGTSAYNMQFSPSPAILRPPDLGLYNAKLRGRSVLQDRAQHPLEF